MQVFPPTAVQKARRDMIFSLSRLEILNPQSDDDDQQTHIMHADVDIGDHHNAIIQERQDKKDKTRKQEPR